MKWKCVGQANNLSVNRDGLCEYHHMQQRHPERHARATVITQTRSNLCKCRCDAEFVCTRTGEHSIDGWLCRQFHSGPELWDTHASAARADVVSMEPRTATSPCSSQVRSLESVKAVRSGSRPGPNNPKPKCRKLSHSDRGAGGDTSVPSFIKKNHNSANSLYNFASYHFGPAVRWTNTSARTSLL